MHATLAFVNEPNAIADARSRGACDWYGRQTANGQGTTRCGPSVYFVIQSYSRCILSS
jgi:hypothetical protein